MRQRIGTGIAKHEHVAASRREDGEPHGKAFPFSNDEEGFASLLGRFRELGADRGSCLVVMESTGHRWMALRGFLSARGYDIAIADPVPADAFRKADTLRKTKTDEAGAFLIAERARSEHLGPTRVSPEDAEGLKQPARRRHHLVKERTAPENRLTSADGRAFPELAGLFSDKHCATARAILREFGSAGRVAETDVRTPARVVREASRGRLGRAKADEAEAAARRSVGTSFAAGAPASGAARIAGLIDHPGGEVGRPGDEIARLAGPEVGELLQTIPGIGPTCAAVIAAGAVGPDRSGGPGKLFAYAGLESSKSQSGQVDGDRQHMPERGSAPLRRALMTAADGARRNDPYFGDRYDSLVARGKHHRVAVSGCARKLCGVILAVLRERRPYEPRPSTRSRQEQPHEG